MRPHALALLALAALLSACATPRLAPQPGAIAAAPADVAARRAALQALPGFSFRGQLAAAAGQEGFSAALDWQQRGASAQLQLRAPLGVGGARLAFDGAALSYTGNDGLALAGDAAHEALRGLLGFEPPLASLRYWLLGVPDPGQPAGDPEAERRDAAGRLLALEQSGWSLQFADYQPAGGQSLPGRITLQRAALRLRLRITRWELP